MQFMLKTTMWTALIKRYWQVSLLKETPANTPYSIFLLGLISLFFFLLIIFQWLIADVEDLFTISSSILAGAALLASYFVYTFALLLVFRIANRLVQTLTCLLAGHVIIHLFAFPLLLITPWLMEANSVQPLALFIGILYLIATLILTVWQFMVTCTDGRLFTGCFSQLWFISM
jgi:hypothetical protein